LEKREPKKEEETGNRKKKKGETKVKDGGKKKRKEKESKTAKCEKGQWGNQVEGALFLSLSLETSL